MEQPSGEMQALTKSAKQPANLTSMFLEKGAEDIRYYFEVFHPHRSCVHKGSFGVSANMCEVLRYGRPVGDRRKIGGMPVGKLR